MNTATKVKQLSEWCGDAALYRLDPPLQDMDDDDKPAQYTYVVVSAVHVPYNGSVETYIFPADADGEVRDFTELNGSLNGVLSHEQALRSAGYEIAAIHA